MGIDNLPLPVSAEHDVSKGSADQSRAVGVRRVGAHGSLVDRCRVKWTGLRVDSGGTATRKGREEMECSYPSQGTITSSMIASKRPRMHLIPSI
jgi:hypothetical protein